jgi:hypothetical protein
LLITAAGYLSLVGYDYLSFGSINKKLPLRAMLARRSSATPWRTARP